MSSLTIRRLTLCALLAATGAAASACGDDAGGSAAGTPAEATELAAGSGESNESAGSGAAAVDPCTLVTNADLEAAFGTPFEEGESSETTAPIVFHTCSFMGSADDLVARTVVIQTLGDADVDEAMDRTAVELYEETRDMTDAATPVADLGEDAYSTPGGINFVQGGTYVSISAPGGASAEATAGLQTIAAAVSSVL